MVMLYPTSKYENPLTTYKRLLDREPIPFVGREEIILEMREHLNEIYNNQGRGMSICGESGVGKTRLVQTFLDSIDNNEVNILKAKVFDSGKKFIEPFDSVINHFFQSSDYKPKVVTNLITLDIAPLILNILPQLKQFYPIEISSKSYSEIEIFSAINQLFENISRLKPTIIFIDDIHLLPQQSNKLLKFILERIDDKALFIIGCFTADNMQDSSIDRNFSGIKSRLFKIALDNFSLDATNKFISGIFEDEFSPSFYRWIFSITKGNPYFIKEFIKELISQNTLNFIENEDKWKIEKNYRSIQVPLSISSVFDSRFNRLDQSKLSFLEVASLIGEQFEPELVRKVLKLSKRNSEKIIARLSQEFFMPVKRTNALQFVHPVQREILKSRISELKSRSIHRKIARILKELKPYEYDSIARHATEFLTPQEQTPELCRLLFNAGKRLANIGNLAAAFNYYKLALKIAKKYGEKLRLAQLIISARLAISTLSLKHELTNQEEASRAADELMRFGLIELAVDLHVTVYRYLYNQCDFQIAVNYISKIIKSLPKDGIGDEVIFRLKIEQCLVWRYTGKIEDARRTIRRLLNKYNVHTNFHAYCYGLNTIGLIYYREGNLHEACEYFKKLVHTADELGHLSIKAVALVNLAAAYTKMGKIEEARTLISQYQQLILKTGQEYKMSIYWGSCAYCALFQGDLNEALQYISKTIENAINTQSRFSSIYIKAEILVYLGRMKEAEEIFTEYPLQQTEKLASEEWIAYAYTVHSSYYLRQKDYSKALRFINKAIKVSEENGLQIEYGVAIILKGIIKFIKSGKKTSLADIRKGKNILREKNAKSYLAMLLCEAGLLTKNTKLLNEGMDLLNEIKVHRWLSFYVKRMKELGLKKIFKYEAPREKLQVRTFGGLSVIKPDGLEGITNKQWKSAKARELFCLLLINAEKKGSTWGELALHLWPDFGTKDAHNNFHFTLSTLREIIGEDCILYENHFYRVNKDKISLDLWEFEDHYKKFKQHKLRGKIHLAQTSVKNAFEISDSDFLPEFHNQLIEAKRLEINSKIEEILLWFANRHLKKFEYNEAIRLSHKLLEKDPVNEAAHRMVMQAYIDSGEKARAVRQYERLTSILKTNFDIEPSEETQRLIQTVQ